MGVANQGYSLLELLIVLTVSTVVISGLLYSLNYIQFLSHDMSLRCDRDVNLWIAPLLFVQWVAGVGNQRWSRMWEGVEFVDGISRFKSDIEGPGGFPDGLLLDSYEEIALDQRGDSLSMRSGAGYFQPVLRGIASFEVERVREDLLLLRWSGQTNHALKTTGTEEQRSAEMKIYLWNYRENLFEEEDH